MLGPTPLPIADALGFLRGSWAVRRHIDDRLAAVVHDFEGEATFSDDGDGLLHVERGRLDVGACVLDSTMVRRYRLRDDGVVDVEFADGRFFHRLDLRTGSWTATHQCKSDRYCGVTTVVAPDVFHVTWHVEGPAKAMEHVATYRRA